MIRNSKTKWQKVHENNSQIRPKIGRILLTIKRVTEIILNQLQ